MSLKNNKKKKNWKTLFVGHFSEKWPTKFSAPLFRKVVFEKVLFGKVLMKYRDLKVLFRKLLFGKV